MRKRARTAVARAKQVNELGRLVQDDPDLLHQLAELIAEKAGIAGAGAPPPPTHRAKRAKKKKSERICYLNEDELHALFTSIRAGGQVRDMAIFEIALGRGLRVSEVGLLAMDRLRLRDQRLYVERVKNGISNEYPLFEREVRALKAWLRERGDAPGPLFPSTWRRAISVRRLDDLMKEYGEAARLPDDKRHFHVLRHTCATRLLERGAHIEQVKDHLGHRDIRNTMIYAQITDRSRRALAKQLAREW